MGQVLGTVQTWHLELYPNSKPTFDCKVGFKKARPPRKMLVTNEELVSARIPPKYRDYCAHYLLDYQVCRHKEMPMLYRCHHEKHDYLNCEQRDYVIRMKEFERERRLREREIRIKEKQKREPEKPEKCRRDIENEKKK